MDTIIEAKLHALFLISDVDNSLTTVDYHPSIHHFTGLVKTCNIDITVTKTLPDASKNFDLIFIDLYCCTWGNTIPLEIQRLAQSERVVFFNAAKNTYDEKLLLLLGVEGIFYHDERLDIVVRGITQLQNNQRWFKRETMNNALSDLLLEINKSNQLSAKVNQQQLSLPTLTRRENTVISLVSLGAKNQEIADQLHISPNTVKTHLYSIFRKTNSRNRIELISWTQSCLTSIN
jgi:DNA-binding NarL/FixJ family response regulator